MVRPVLLIIAIGAQWLGCVPVTTVSAAEPGGRAVILDDNQAYTKGSFTAFMAPFNKGKLKAGTDYTERFELDPVRFPGNSFVSWHWPAARADGPIRGFIAVDYGDYENTTPEAPIQSAKVDDIDRLSCDYQLSLDGDVSSFDVIIDFYLTSIRATADDDFDKSTKFEVEIFLHTPDYAKSYADSVPPVGTFISKSGVVWNVSRDPTAPHGPDILFYPSDQADIPTGNIDIKAMLSWLKSQNVITGREYFNGLALGVEPRQLDGTLAVHDLRVRYAVSE